MWSYFRWMADVWKFAKTERHVPIPDACCTSRVWLHTLSPDKLVKVMQFFATSACNCRASLRLRRAHKCSFTILGTWAPSRIAFICTKSRPYRSAVGPCLCQCRMKDIQGDKMSPLTLLHRTLDHICVESIVHVQFLGSKVSRTTEKLTSSLRTHLIMPILQT